MGKSLLLPLALLVVLWIHSSESCSCIPTHPQQQFCNADFVILARIKREKVVDMQREYKIRIRKEYKMSEKAEVALKYGRFLTPESESMCGQQFEVGKVYVISGKISNLQAHVNMCGLSEKWVDLTKRQRKGLKMLYRQGCSCQVKFCPPNRNCARKINECNWETWRPDKKQDCQRNEGICMRSMRNQCTWSKSASLMACSKNTTVLHYEPKKKLRVKRPNLPFHDDLGRKFGRSKGRNPFREFVAVEPYVQKPMVYPG